MRRKKKHHLLYIIWGTNRYVTQQMSETNRYVTQDVEKKYLCYTRCGKQIAMLPGILQQDAGKQITMVHNKCGKQNRSVTQAARNESLCYTNKMWETCSYATQYLGKESLRYLHKMRGTSRYATKNLGNKIDMLYVHNSTQDLGN